MTAVRDAAHWRYEIEAAMDPRYTVTVAIIANAAGEAVGSLVYYGELSDGRLVTLGCELVAGVSWLAVMPSLLRALKTRGEAMDQAHESGPLRELYFGLGGDHPLYHVLPESLAAGPPAVRVVPARAGSARVPAACRAGAGGAAGGVRGVWPQRRAAAELLPGGLRAGA